MAAWLYFITQITSDGFNQPFMSALNFLGFVSAVIGLQQANRERNQNEASFNPRSRTFAIVALVLAVPGLLIVLP